MDEGVKIFRYFFDNFIIGEFGCIKSYDLTYRLPDDVNDKTNGNNLCVMSIKLYVNDVDMDKWRLITRTVFSYKILLGLSDTHSLLIMRGKQVYY